MLLGWMAGLVRHGQRASCCFSQFVRISAPCYLSMQFASILLRVCVCVAVDFVSNNACLCIYVYMYICIYVYMYICIYVYMYICIYVNMCICVYIYIYISASNLKHQPSTTRNNNRTHLLLFAKYNN